LSDLVDFLVVCIKVRCLGSAHGVFREVDQVTKLLHVPPFFDSVRSALAVLGLVILLVLDDPAQTNRHIFLLELIFRLVIDLHELLLTHRRGQLTGGLPVSL